MIRGLLPSPAAYLNSGQPWPDGALNTSTPPEEFLLARHVSRVFGAYCAAHGLSTYNVQQKTNVSASVIAKMLSGRSWPSFALVACLEHEYGIALWMSQQHLGQPPLAPGPASYLVSGAPWPTGALQPGAPPEAHRAKKISQKFHSLYYARPHSQQTQIAPRAGISQHAVQTLLDGTAWPDLSTITRLEKSLPGKIKLWT